MVGCFGVGDVRLGDIAFATEMDSVAVLAVMKDKQNKGTGQTDLSSRVANLQNHHP